MVKVKKINYRKTGLPEKETFPPMPTVTDMQLAQAKKKLLAQQQGFLAVLPLVALCHGIKLIMDEIERRGIHIYDFDHKTKYVQDIQIIGGTVYFLVAEGEDAHEKV